MKAKPFLQVKDLTQIVVMSALIAVCSWISIPMAVPFTLQTFAVFVALSLLGGKKGTIAIVIYILLGLVGLPVFSSFKSGFGALAGPTGGYIWGFILIGGLYWSLEKVFQHPIIRLVILVVGLFLCYLMGTIQFTAYMNAHGTSYTFYKALTVCVIPFIIPDIAKLVLAYFISGRLKKIITL